MAKIFFLPVNTGYFIDGLPDQRTYDFYSSRSGNGLYCAIVGNIVISNGFPTNTSCGVISNDSRWKDLSSAIRDNGAKPGIQLSTTWRNYKGQRSFRSRDSASADAQYRDAARELSDKSISAMFAEFSKSTVMAASNGFDHVQIHAAHGYLLCVALDPVISPFADAVREHLIDWASAARAMGLETSIRISWQSGISEDRDARRQVLLSQLFNHAVSFIDISAGYYNVDKHYIYPQNAEMLDYRLREAFTLAEIYPDQNFICSGRIDIGKTNDWRGNLHAGVCRDLIAHPNFLKDRIKRCNNHKMCHYYSRGMQHIDCGTWHG